MFYRPQDFEFSRVLESHFATIRKEYLQIAEYRELMVPYPQKNIYNFGWDLFAFYLYTKKIDVLCELCPETTKIVESLPDMVSASFSILRKGAKIEPHQDPKGYAEYVYRCHLPLIVPESCYFTVGEETQAWVEGKCMVFCGANFHSAVNQGSFDRACLIVDIKMAPDVPLILHDIQPSDYLK